MSAAPASAPAAGRTTEGCRYCWMCRQACPVGHVTARETYTPHAWALVIESVARKQLSWTRETADVMYACADCGLCQAHCATDQPLPDAIVATRTELASAGIAPPAVYEVDRQLKAHGGAYGPAAPQGGVEKAATVLFVGDAAPHFGAASVAAARKLLQAAGAAAPAIGEGRATGLLASTLGLRDTAVALARTVVDEVKASGAKEVLVLGPGDRWAFEHVYPKRLGVAWPEGVAIREVTDVLAASHAGGRLRIRQAPEGTYAYHDPCHTPRLDPARKSARALLAAALGPSGAKNLFFRERRSHPCGATGGLEFTRPQLADQLADARLDDAKRAGASCLVTDDPLCLHQLASRAGGGVTVKGLYELLAERV